MHSQIVLARLAGTLCRRARFQQWVSSRVGAAPGEVSAQQHAADFVRTQCGVASRSQLDRDGKAAALFHLRVRKPFLAWLEAQSK